MNSTNYMQCKLFTYLNVPCLLPHRCTDVLEAIRSKACGLASLSEMFVEAMTSNKDVKAKSASESFMINQTNGWKLGKINTKNKCVCFAMLGFLFLLNYIVIIRIFYTMNAI